MNTVFQFASLSEFLDMNGHGTFVLTCYIVTSVALCYLAVVPRLQRKAFLKIQKAIYSREDQE